MSNKVAIAAHVFYEDIWPELVKCIDGFISECGADNVDAYLTYPDSKPHLERILKCSAPVCVKGMFALPNIGYDVAPFFHVLNNLNLDAYDYVVKLHTKRDMPFCVVNYHIYWGDRWRRVLLSFCSSRKAVRQSLKAMQRDPSLGMIAGRAIIDPSGVGSWTHGPVEARHMLEGLGIKTNDDCVVCGTVFMVRASILKCIQGRFELADFEPIDQDCPHGKYGLAGIWEGAFGLLVGSQGYRIAFGRWPRPLSKMFYATKRIALRVLRQCSNFVRFIGRCLLRR